MSTTVDNPPLRRPRQSAAATREAVLLAARRAFSQASYDAVGIREIASLAGTDPAVVIRLFGSKPGLFAATADAAFAGEPVFDGPIVNLHLRLAALLTGPAGPPGQAPDQAGDFQFLLRSATSAVAAPILARALHERLVQPLARRIARPDAELRAALVTSQILGFATLRFALGSPAIDQADPAATGRHLAAAMQRLITGT